MPFPFLSCVCGKGHLKSCHRPRLRAACKTSVVSAHPLTFITMFHDFGHPINDNGEKLSTTDSNKLSRQINLNLSSDQYERLFFQPSAAKGDLAKRFGMNPLSPTFQRICSPTCQRKSHVAQRLGFPGPVQRHNVLPSRVQGCELFLPTRH